MQQVNYTKQRSRLATHSAVTLATDPRDIGNRPKSGDLQVSALYNFNIQPAMARPISCGESS